MPIFKPEGGEPLVVRGTIGAVPEHNSKTNMLPMTQKDFAGARPSTGAKVRFGQLTQSSFFARHNPQPGRVRHIKGLLDFPICAVHDDGFVKYPKLRLRERRNTDVRQSLPVRLPIQSINYHPNHINRPLQAHQVNQLEASKYFQKYPVSVRERADPNLGLIPYTDAWRDELVSLVEKAGLGLPQEVKDHQREQPKRTSVYSAETGRLIPPPSRAMSRGASRQRKREPFLHIAPEQSNETLVLEMLCQILQTDSIGAVQEWLVSSGDKEKDLALNIIKVALGAEDTYWKQPEEVLGIHSLDSLLDGRPMSQPPPNMIVENGYAEMDRPSPRPRVGTSMARLGTGGSFSRYMHEGDKRLPGSPRQQTKYESGDHPSLRPSSHKPDILKIDHSMNQTSRPYSQPGLDPIVSPRGRKASPLPGAPQRGQVLSRAEGSGI